MPEPIYLDHAATSPLRPEAQAAMEEGFRLWANPSSPHAEGRKARAALEDAPRHGETIVAQPNGRPYSYQLAWKRIMEVRVAIGAEHLDIHSLRYTTACEIVALPGMTLEHVRAITGHTAADMAAHYAAATMVTARAREAQNARTTKRERGNAS